MFIHILTMGSDNSLLGIIIGFSCGLAIGLGSGSSEKPQKPIEVVQEYRNNDTILDIVQKFEDESEIVLYSYEDKQGNIQYKAEE